MGKPVTITSARSEVYKDDFRFGKLLNSGPALA